MSIFDLRTLSEIALGRLRAHSEPRIRSSQETLLEAARMEREIRNHQRLPW
ncbi:MAG: hypothetical protein J0I14_02700 [Propionibacteriaceae bacterium]|jgi:hypothetical protein|nr:hypothetical protein [Propionibacteriaceae bacterium]